MSFRRTTLAYAYHFEHALKTYGPYDIVHSHNYLFSGFDLFLAWCGGIKTRIAHIYPTEDLKARTGGWSRTVYRRAMTAGICRYANHVLFDSQQAKDAFATLAGRQSDKFSVLYCGIELVPFRQTVSTTEDIRTELAIPLDSKVIITVARYAPHKNHFHVLEIARQVVAKRDDVIFLLVGDGPLYAEVRQRVEQMGLDAKFRFVRARPEIISLYKAADLLLFPSLHEGFGLVVVEAAAAGLPVVASRIPGILDAAKACPDPSLIAPNDTDGFVQAVLDCLERPKGDFVPNRELLSPFDIHTSVARLMDIYVQHQTRTEHTAGRAFV